MGAELKGLRARICGESPSTRRSMAPLYPSLLGSRDAECDQTAIFPNWDMKHGQTAMLTPDHAVIRRT